DGIRDRTVTGVQTCALPIWDSKLESEVLLRGCSDPRVQLLGSVELRVYAAADQSGACRRQLLQPGLPRFQQQLRYKSNGLVPQPGRDHQRAAHSGGSKH